jgi:hypothetical protein
MADAPKYRDEPLPVTAEVGGEGGSFADPTYQESTRRERLPRQPETAQPNAESDAAQYASHGEQIEEGGAGTAPGPGEGMKRYPTDDPA